MASLSEALQNAILFAGDTKSASGGLIAVQANPEGFIVEAYDDHTYVKTVVDFPGDYGSGAQYFFSAKDLRELLKDETKSIWDYESHPDPGCFSDASEMVTQPAAMLDGFYFSVDRWKKLGSLKPAGLPMQFKIHDYAGFQYGSFKYGDTVGLVSFLDRDVLEEEGML